MNLPKCFRISMSMKGAVSPAFCLVVIGAFIMTMTACGKETEEAPREVIRPVKTITVSADVEVSGLTLPGRVRASQRVELAFKEVGGRLIELPIAGREGQEVNQGELLARIDPKDFETDLSRVQGRLKEAVANLDLAKAEYKRVQRIQKKDAGAVSGADIDRKREAVNVMQGRIRALRAAVESAKNQLSYTYLKAPFAGLIAQRFVDNFQNVKPKQPILALEDVSSVEILVNVPENVVAMAKSASDDDIDATATFPTAPNQKFPLSLKEYATRADSATQTYQVVLHMPQPENLNILPGMTANVILSIGSHSTGKNVLFIPAIAVMAQPDGSGFVWVVDSDKMTVHKQTVKIGRIEGSEDIEIFEGLEGGEKIVVAGVLKLQEGMQVRFWKQQ